MIGKVICIFGTVIELSIIILLKLNIIILSNGTVKFFNDTKGFGFISPEDGSKDIFVHVSGLNDDIREGDTVSYDVEEGKKGPNAVNVTVV